MIIYSGSKAEFMAEVLDDTIAYTIRDSIFEETHRKTPDAEFHSWVNSLEYMYKVLNDGGVPQNSGVAIEYNPPNTAKRVDFLISGYDASHSPNVVIIELKRWETLKKSKGSTAWWKPIRGERTDAWFILHTRRGAMRRRSGTATSTPRSPISGSGRAHICTIIFEWKTILWTIRFTRIISMTLRPLQRGGR